MNKGIIAFAAAAAFSVSSCADTDEAGRVEGTANETAAATENAAEPAGIQPVDAAVVAVAEREPYGRYLVDGQGRALYVLEPQAEGAQPQQLDAAARAQRCTGACLGEWPPMLSRGTPQAGPGADAGKLGTVPRDGGTQVTYAGWPLYYYRGDRDAGMVSGHHMHDQWGEWYLLSPEGERIESGEPTEG